MTFLNLTLGRPVVRAAETVTGELGVVGARFIMDGGPSEGRFSLVEHPIVPRGLAAPVHLHTREDEFSFVLEGRWGFMLGSDVVYAAPGDLVYKPRDVCTPSGTRLISLHVSWRSSPRLGSSSSSSNWTTF
jgi:mannose-6-phosphate isomerase-like protein (cupin superfamily)